MQHSFLVFVYHSFRSKSSFEKKQIKRLCNKMLNFQDLPDELILKILRYSETKDLIFFGQVSKRIRKISRDSTLWVTANLVKKIVKTELLEMILSNGCKILNISNSDVVGTLSSNIISQLRFLDLSTRPTRILDQKWIKWIKKEHSKETMEVFEELMFSCCSLQHLNIKGLLLTPKMAEGICKNGKTLQVLNLNHAYYIYNRLGFTVLENGILGAIIKCCQELKELDFVKGNDVWLDDDNVKFLAKNISPNIVRLNLNDHGINDDNVKILLSRCNKIKVLALEATSNGSDGSLKTIRQYLNHTLEELSLSFYGYIGFSGVHELKSMQRLKILNLHCSSKEHDEEVQNLRQYLPHLMIRTFFD